MAILAMAMVDFLGGVDMVEQAKKLALTTFTTLMCVVRNRRYGNFLTVQMVRAPASNSTIYVDCIVDLEKISREHMRQPYRCH